MRWVIAVLSFLCVVPALAQEKAIEAVLSKELNADHLDVGSAFTLKVRSNWERAECRLAPGMLLHATVRNVTRAANGHVQTVGFVLGAPCGDKEPLDLVVTSLLAPPKVETVMEQFPSYNSSGGGSGKMPSAAPLNADPGGQMHGAPMGLNPIQVKTNALPGTVTLGEVWRLPKVKLEVPTGSSVVSTVATTGRTLQLPEETIVVLQRARAEVRAVRTMPITVTPTAAARPRAEAPFLSACRTGHCSVYPAALMTGGSGYRQVGADLDLQPIGFRPEHDREVHELEPGTTVHFLGQDEVLLTFPTHALVKRTGAERPTDDPRSVRAVLLDVKTRTVKRTLDWVVDDHSDYAWACGQNLLVHDGHILRLYGPGLEELASLTLDIPLFSLRASPDGGHLLLGELRELHTPQEHRALLESDKHGPQEEVLWSLLDGRLQRVRVLGTSSNFVPTPVLLNGGMVELRKGRDPEWTLVGRTWEGGSEKRLGGLRSSCLPTLGGVAPNLLTIGVCDVSGDRMHTFVVHDDGSPVVEQVSGDQDMPLSFMAASATPRVAMMVTRASEAYSRGLLFHLSVIQNQAIEVFGTERGEMLARMPVTETAPYREPFALSPDGAMLAVLSGHHLSFYAVGDRSR